MSFIRYFHRLFLSRQNFPFVMGLLAGFFFSLFIGPVVDDGCHSSQINFQREKLMSVRNFLHSSIVSGSDPKKQTYNQDSYDFDDYEPRINLAGKPQSAKKEPKPFIRPRYYSTELGIKEKWFAVYFSSLKRIPTLGIAINETLTHHNQRLAFFVDISNKEKLDLKTLPIVGFRDSQQGFLTLHTLKYLMDKLLPAYNFFFLSRDSTFVNGRRLNEFINHISVTEHVYMGVPVTDQLFGSSVCSLDAGILISSSVLSALNPVIESCTEDFAFGTDDEKIGLCINKALNLTCQTKIGDQYYSSFQLDDVSNIQELEAAWNSNADLSNALTSHPLKEPAHFYLLDKLSSATSLMEAEQEIRKLEESILKIAPLTPGGIDSVSWPIGYAPASKPDNRFDVLRWEFFNESHIFLDTEQSVVHPLGGVHLEDIQEILKESTAYALKLHSGSQFVRLVNGYKRFDPTRGLDYVLDLLLRQDGQDAVVRIEACRPITHVETVPMPYVTESSRVNILLPVWRKEDAEPATKLVTNLSRYLVTKSENAHLFVVLLYPPGTSENPDVFASVKGAVSQLNRPKAEIDLAVFKWNPNSDWERRPVDLTVVDLMSSHKKLGVDSLIFLCHPHSEIQADFLNRVRINTISGWQIFSPVPFAEYNPDVSRLSSTLPSAELNVSTNQGFYDTFHTWHISFYLADYLNARKSFEVEFPLVRSEKDLEGWRPSPYPSILVMFSRLRRLHILRAVEPQLHLRYHVPRCGSTESLSCHKSWILSQGTRSQLAKLYSDSQIFPNHLDLKRSEH